MTVSGVAMKAGRLHGIAGGDAGGTLKLNGLFGIGGYLGRWDAYSATWSIGDLIARQSLAGAEGQQGHGCLTRCSDADR